MRGCHLPPKSERDMGVERSAGALGGEGGEVNSKYCLVENKARMSYSCEKLVNS